MHQVVWFVLFLIAWVLAILGQALWDALRK